MGVNRISMNATFRNPLTRKRSLDTLFELLYSVLTLIESVTRSTMKTLAREIAQVTVQAIVTIAALSLVAFLILQHVLQSG
jgi:hypothetical protein